MKEFTKNPIICLVCLLLSFIIVFPINVMAMNKIDEERDIKFTITYKNEDMVLSNTQIAIYRVGNIDEFGNTRIREEFSKYPVDFKSLNSKELNDYALTLKGYVEKDGLRPLLTGITDDNGVFTASLKPGLYLIIGRQTEIDGFQYESNPFFVLLKSSDNMEDWEHEITSYPKIIKEEVRKEVINKRVIKVWKDQGHEAERPEKIEVELLANGNIYEVITLSKYNNWRYSWEGLDSNFDWSVVEKDIEGNKYKPLITEEGNVFIIENIYKSEEKETELEEDDENTSTKVDSYKEDDITKPETLPQTGQNWWLMYFLLGFGILFIIIGYVQTKRKKVDK